MNASLTKFVIATLMGALLSLQASNLLAHEKIHGLSRHNHYDHVHVFHHPSWKKKDHKRRAKKRDDDWYRKRIFTNRLPRTWDHYRESKAMLIYSNRL